MRITIDARMMGAGKTRGIGRYIEEIIRAILRLHPQHDFTLLVKDVETSPFKDQESIQHVAADIPWYGIKEQLLMPRLIRRTQPDLLFVPHWNVSLFDRTPRIVFIHDLILLEEHDSAAISTRQPWLAKIKHLGFRVILRYALKTSRMILVPTKFTKQWIQKKFPSIKTPIHVTGEGMPDVQESLWVEAGLEQPYFLMVGSAYPHKNHEAVLDAWKKLSQRYPHVQLKIVGEQDAFMNRLMRRFEEEQVESIQFIGAVSDQELQHLYQKALALIFASRWEGFGLPPLEALAFGCPVISSNSSCLPEVLGNEGILYFQVDAPDDIVRAVETVLHNPRAIREEARKVVPLLRKRHDWRLAAARTLEAFEETIRS